MSEEIKTVHVNPAFNAWFAKRAFVYAGEVDYWKFRCQQAERLLNNQYWRWCNEHRVYHRYEAELYKAVCCGMRLDCRTKRTLNPKCDEGHCIAWICIDCYRKNQCDRCKKSVCNSVLHIPEKHSPGCFLFKNEQGEQFCHDCWKQEKTKL